MNSKYYVIKKDNVVQEAKNLIDYLVMKLGLEHFINGLQALFKRILEKITSLRQLEEARKFFDDVIMKVIVFLDHLQLGKV